MKLFALVTSHTYNALISDFYRVSKEVCVGRGATAAAEIVLPEVSQKRLGRIQAREIGRLQEHLRQRIQRLRRHVHGSVAARFQAPHDRRRQLPVSKEEPLQRRLHGLQRLQQIYLPEVVALAPPPAVEQPHRGVLHPRPPVRVRLHPQDPRHRPLQVLAGARHLEQRRRAEAERLRAGGGLDAQLALQPEEVVRVHQKVEVLHLRQQLPHALEQPAVAPGLHPVLGVHPLLDPSQELAGGEEPRLEDLMDRAERLVFVVLGVLRSGRAPLQGVEVGWADDEIVLERGLPCEVGLAQPQSEPAPLHLALDLEQDLGGHVLRLLPRRQPRQQALLARAAHHAGGAGGLPPPASSCPVTEGPRTS
ncbi:hypothetical protein MUK42_02533 [Musa troglodytarum]|uniref:Uncharacterized protein n=1 Tax=Musa troglodytarum TaxID=320322 RepID=A0A9E7JHK1_9LILI|nr:hypothetical protein MUK42_02533 [Musa troglodytarum]